jgi:lipoprotein signal peptidase
MSWIKGRLGAFMTIILLTGFIIATVIALGWPYEARLFPLTISLPVLVMLVFQVLRDLGVGKKGDNSPGAVMDLPVDRDMPVATLLRRAGTAFGWFFGLILGIWLIGFVPSIPLFVLLYLLIQGREKVRVALLATAAITALQLGVFDRVVHVAWLEPQFPWIQRFILDWVGSG